MAKPVVAGSTPMTFVCSIICVPDRDARRATTGDATAGSATASRFDHEAPVTTPERSGQQRRADGPSSRSTSRPAARASRAACSSFGWSAGAKPRYTCPPETTPQSSPVRRARSSQIACALKRQGKFRRIAPLKTQIAEVDGARCGAQPVLLDHRDRAPSLAQEIGREATHEPAADNRHVDGCGCHCVPGSDASRCRRQGTGSARGQGGHDKGKHMTDPCDILIFGTGSFAQRIACDLAATATKPTRVAIAGRNALRLAWIRTAARARADMFGRPVAIDTHDDRSRRRRPCRRAAGEAPAHRHRAGGITADGLRYFRRRQRVDAPRRRRRIECDGRVPGRADRAYRPRGRAGLPCKAV